MRQTLFSLPAEILHVPVFGVGWLLAAWCLAALGLAVWLVRRQGWSVDTFTQLGMFALSGVALSFLPLWFDLVGEDGLPIRGYGVLLLLAVSSAVGVSMRRAMQMGQDPELILSAGTWLFCFGILGARIFYVIEYWQHFQRPTVIETVRSVLNVAQGGLVVYGSLFGGGIALFLFVKKHRLPWLAMCDLVAPGLVLGMALGRLGCFMNGCCYGGLSTLPWAVTFPFGTPPFIDQVQKGELPVHGLWFAADGQAPATIAKVEPNSDAASHGLKAGDTIASINGAPVRSIEQAESILLSQARVGSPISIRLAGEPRLHEWDVTAPLPRSRRLHPAQLYSAIDAFLLCGFLLAYSPFRKRDGELFAWLLTIHPITRFLLEAIRVDEGLVGRTHMTISQNISMLLFASGILFWIYLLRQPVGLAWARQAVPAEPISPNAGHPASMAT
jgi:phosphatidylglycerol:prolipoprotein diacylglycerol transferase